ncbi:MAG: hypothetical protein M0C28_17760 [Candidatus Moduliflexus flocculans]|nr:hypothetical protein [Candidatus Moduliflexus flocculans]
MEVEILEVNRTKAERARAGSRHLPVTASLSDGQLKKSDGSLRQVWETQAPLTLPSATPEPSRMSTPRSSPTSRIRVLNGKSAKIHIGDRRWRASVIQDAATGQVRTTYDYKDIGIKLTAEPTLIWTTPAP